MPLFPRLHTGIDGGGLLQGLLKLHSRDSEAGVESDLALRVEPTCGARGNSLFHSYCISDGTWGVQGKYQ